MDIQTLDKLDTKAQKSSQNDFLKLGAALLFLLAVLWG